MNRSTKIFHLTLSAVLLASSNLLFSQNFSTIDYKKALWMTTRFYGGQRSGQNNWLLYNHLPAGLNEKYRGKSFFEDKDSDDYDLSGGWYNAGDHVKTGHTMFYSAYMLLKAYAEFPTGYDDYYDTAYSGYKTANSWSWEEKKHSPNRIPDILDEIKHATDYFIKCARNSNTFYYQVGKSGLDHAEWVTSVKMQTNPQTFGGQTRPVYKNPNDASMPSFCGATLALMSRMYRKFDPNYADKCLIAATHAYEYAKAHPGTAGSQDEDSYPASDNWKDDYVTLCAELFWATQHESYKKEAFSFSFGVSNGDVYGKNYGFDYSNNGDIAIYNLALLGNAEAKTIFNSIVSNYYLNVVQADGQFAGGNRGWGPLRYNANTALMVALWQKLNDDNSVHKYIYDNIDYILGKNTGKQSFIVGFGTKQVMFPHHRNIYLNDDNPDEDARTKMTIPYKNQQFGGLVGGTRNPSLFYDDVNNFITAEGGIDHNACLVGALAYINSKLAPVDTSIFSLDTIVYRPAQVSLEEVETEIECNKKGVALSFVSNSDGQIEWKVSSGPAYKLADSLYVSGKGSIKIHVEQAQKYPYSAKDTLFEIQASCPILVYQYITPNGDGFNDNFHIKNIEFYPDNSVSVINKWQEEIFSTQGYTNKWSPSKFQAGTYYYIVHVKAENTVYKGSLLVEKE